MIYDRTCKMGLDRTHRRVMFWSKYYLVCTC